MYFPPGDIRGCSSKWPVVSRTVFPFSQSHSEPLRLKIRRRVPESQAGEVPSPISISVFLSRSVSSRVSSPSSARQAQESEASSSCLYGINIFAV
ncbi:MAG: hypothetical protein PHV59_09950 [Victivallales bacterium]|nr:hypothetical protein [Victivallales bacterium]